MNKAPFTQYKRFDHEDVQTEFHADRWLMLAGNAFASVVVFLLLLGAITLLARFPTSWIGWLVLATWGV